MVSNSLIRHLLSDKHSLEDYNNAHVPSFEDVRRRLLLLERNEKSSIPDHYYRLKSENSFNNIDSLADTIRVGLYRLAKEHLELRNNKIYVKQNRQNDWQELITNIPPLVIQMAFLHIEAPMRDRSNLGILGYFNKYILPNTKYTALPYPYIPQIEHYIKEKSGLHDLHMHLNGATETDIAWQDFLTHPDKIYTEIQKKAREPMVRELIEQESSLCSPLDFRNMLLSARNTREWLFHMLFQSHSDKSNLLKFSSVEHVFHHILDAKNPATSEEEQLIPVSVFHPFGSLVQLTTSLPKYPMAIEGLMYVLVFRYLSEKPKELVAYLFHFYLLILGLANRLLVQQRDQYGFEQFQKITLNQLREDSEQSSYKNRFFQIQGNDRRNIRFLEGRFSPKATEKENSFLITSINEGWKVLLKNIEKEFPFTKTEGPQLKLIAHFIKKKDDESFDGIRHRALRADVWKRATVLAVQKRNNPVLMKNVVGIDAAASEFDAPPEVFAPSFRYLRRNGFKHFTYHAGEDFFHIISGLRAIYEAVTFNSLSCGDRIGHATAAGLSPERWIENVGPKILIRQGSYLDDLLFTYHLTISTKNETLKRSLPALINKMHELSWVIYRKSYSLKTLEDAWLRRRFCPMLLFSESKENAKYEEVYNDDEWTDIQRGFTDLKYDERIEVLRKYHCRDFRQAYDKIIEVEVEEFYNCSELNILQKLVLEILHDREIVIETLPTSNVRIGHHSDFTTYHLWNWLEWEKQGAAIPPIVIGTDDPGIFATNIYNEYANIYCNLTCHKKMSHTEAMEVIEKLDRNAQIYRFT